MGIQTTAGFKKEFLACFRTGRLFFLALSVIGLGIFSPLLLVGLGSLIESMGDIYDQVGIDISGMLGFLSSASSLGVSQSITDITGVGLLVFLLLINNAAGGEQKRRDIIIPRSAGLRSFGYLFPKFIIYPLAALIFTVLAIFASWGISTAVFEVSDVSFEQALLSGILTGMCLMLYVCCHLTLGTATGKPGMSAAVCIVASYIIPSIFSLVGAEYMFNPFGLNGLASTVVIAGEVTSGEMRDIATTMAFAVALFILTYLVALFAQNAKKVDNSGNEMEL